MDRYIDRQHAGQVLAQQLESYACREDVIALALPRGGVPIAYEIAKKLSIELDVFIVRKLGVPQHKELAMGAIASGETVFLNESLIDDLHISREAIDQAIQEEKAELQRRETTYHSHFNTARLEGKTILLVDDGIATGATMRVAILALRKHNPAEIIVVAPVASKEAYEDMMSLADSVICPLTSLHFYAVGYWYENFTQTTDNEVCELLMKAKVSQQTKQ